METDTGETVHDAWDQASTPSLGHDIEPPRHPDPARGAGMEDFTQKPTDASYIICHMKINIFNKKGKSVEAFFLTIVRLLSTLLTLVCIKIVSVHFSLEEYGTYSEALLIVTTFTSITILGMTDAVNFFYNNTPSEHAERNRNFISTIFFLQLIIGTLGGLFILLSENILTIYFENPALSSAYVWIAFQPLMANLLPMIQVLYISIGKVKVILIRNLIICFIRFAIFLYATYATGSIITILALTFICDFLQVLYFIFDLHTHGIKLFNLDLFDNRLIRPILSYSIPMAVFIVLNALLRDIDKWIIGYFGTTDELGIYANCSRVLPYDMLMTSFSTILIPVITSNIQNNKPWVTSIFSAYLNLGILSTMILVGSSIICAKDLLLTLYDYKFVSGLGVFIIYLLVDLLRFANISLIYSSTGQAAKLLSIAIQSLILNIIAGIGLYCTIGILGPAIATLMTMLYANMLYLRGAGKILDTSLFSRFNWHKIIEITASLCVMGFLAHYVQSDILPDMNHVPRLIICMSIILFILFLLFRRPIMGYVREINSVK